MKEKITESFELYEQGKEYNIKIDYYNTCETNERFAFGDQWAGVESKGLPTPQFNQFKRIINYMVAYLCSSPYKINYSMQNIPKDNPNYESIKETISNMNKIVEAKWETDKIDMLIKNALLNSVTSGDMCSYTYWDSEVDTGQQEVSGVKPMGDYVTELLDGVNVMLGNTSDVRINVNGRAYQPYILIIGRDTVARLKAEGKKNGINAKELEKIVGDSELEYKAGELSKQEQSNRSDLTAKTTYIVKFWYDEETKTVKFNKSTKTVEIQKETDTKMKIYPVAFSNWDSRKNCYHGQALITNCIENQKYINKQMAMMMIYYMRMANPKIIYDSNRLNGWNNSISEAIAADGDPNNIVKILQTPNMPNGISELVRQAIDMTVQSLGANEVLLGNVKPDNAQAIIQVTQQASIPLLNQKLNLMDFIEQMAIIWLEFIRTKYGNVDRIATVSDGDEEDVVKFNAGTIMDTIIRPKIEVGPSNWWNETKAVETLDNLYKSGVLDVLQYLERMPDGYIPDKDKVIEDYRKKFGMEQQTKEQQYTALAELYDGLPPNEQKRLQAMGPEKMEEELLMMLQGNTQVPVQGQMEQMPIA